MAQSRRNWLLPLFVVSVCGIAAGGASIARRSNTAAPLAVGATRAPIAAPATVLLSDSTSNASPAIGTAWLPVAWNDDSSTGVRFKGVDEAAPLATPRQPVVTVAQRRPRTGSTSAASAAAAPLNGPLPTSAANAAPLPLAATVSPSATPLTAPADNVSPLDVSAPPEPAEPVVRIVQAPQLSQLSVIEVGPGAESAPEEAPAAEPVSQTDSSPSAPPAATEPLTPAAIIAQGNSSVASPSPAASRTDVAQNDDHRTRELADPTDELFAPPPLPRGNPVAPRSRARRMAKAAAAPQQRPASTAATADSNPQVASLVPTLQDDKSPDSTDDNATARVTETTSVAQESPLRVAMPDSGGVSFLPQPKPAETTGVTPTQGTPKAPTVVAAAPPAGSDSEIPNAVAPETSTAAVPALTQPKSEQLAKPKSATVAQQPLMRPARDVASSSSAKMARTRSVPPQPVAPWALPPAARPGIAWQEPRQVTSQASPAAQPQVMKLPPPPRSAPQTVQAQPAPAREAVTASQPLRRPMAGPPRVAAQPPRPTPAPMAPAPPVPAAAGAARVAQADNLPAAQPPFNVTLPQTLPLANMPPARPPYLMVVAGRAQEHIDYGFNLAERGATFSAESEFTEALLLVAQALDAAENTRAHSEAMKAGLRAFREADDFVPRDTVEPQIAQVVATHHTPVLKRATNLQMPLLVAMQDYYSYAQYQLSIAGGHEPTAAAALYGLARLQPVLGNGSSDAKKMMCGPKAVALHQAALAIDPTNFAAANELGVLLARYGQWPEAQAAFLHSVCISPQPQIWRNLAVSYQVLGDTTASKNAWDRYELARQQSGSDTAGGGDRPLVKFVDPQTFARSAGGPEAGDMTFSQENLPDRDQGSQVRQTAARQPVPPPAAPQASSDGYSLNWLKSKFSAARQKTAQQNTSAQPQLR